MKRFICAFSALAATVLLAISCSSFVEDLHLDAVPTADSSVSVTTEYDAHAEFTISAESTDGATSYNCFINGTPHDFTPVSYEWYVDGALKKTSETSAGMSYLWDYSGYESGNYMIMLIIKNSSDEYLSASIKLTVSN